MRVDDWVEGKTAHGLPFRGRVVERSAHSSGLSDGTWTPDALVARVRPAREEFRRAMHLLRMDIARWRRNLT